MRYKSYILPGSNPSWRHTTLASLVPNPELQTVPQALLMQTSTRPRVLFAPPSSLMSPSLQFPDWVASAKNKMEILACQNTTWSDGLLYFGTWPRHLPVKNKSWRPVGRTAAWPPVHYSWVMSTVLVLKNQKNKHHHHYWWVLLLWSKMN